MDWCRSGCCPVQRTRSPVRAAHNASVCGPCVVKQSGTIAGASQFQFQFHLYCKCGLYTCSVLQCGQVLLCTVVYATRYKQISSGRFGAEKQSLPWPCSSFQACALKQLQPGGCAQYIQKIVMRMNKDCSSVVLPPPDPSRPTHEFTLRWVVTCTDHH